MRAIENQAKVYIAFRTCFTSGKRSKQNYSLDSWELSCLERNRMRNRIDIRGMARVYLMQYFAKQSFHLVKAFPICIRLLIGHSLTQEIQECVRFRKTILASILAHYLNFMTRKPHCDR